MKQPEQHDGFLNHIDLNFESACTQIFGRPLPFDFD